jgi:hypothetical protein
MIASGPQEFIGTNPREDAAGGLVGKPKTAGYAPSVMWSMWQTSNRTPPFHIMRVPWMLIDPRLQFGLYLIKGPIAAKSKIFVKCDNPEAKAYIVKALCRFWQNSLMRALEAVQWGFSASEVVDRRAPDGTIEFHGLKSLYPLDVTAIENITEGTITGVRVGNMPGGKIATLRAPHFFWHVHGREHSPIFGLSRFFPAWKTFLEKWDSGGYRDIRRLFYYKNAFSSGQIWHPDTDLPTSGGGFISAQQYAQQLLEQARTGGSMTFPNASTIVNGQQDWIYQPPSAVPPPPGMDSYGDRLDDELFEALGIPGEIANAQGTGAFAGRVVPKEAFMASEQELLNWLLCDIKDQILDPRVSYNFGPTEYELQPYSMLQEEDEEENVGNVALQQAQQGGGDPDGTAMSHIFDSGEFRDSGAICLHPYTGRWRDARTKRVA